MKKFFFLSLSYLLFINLLVAQSEKFITIELSANKLVNEKKWDDLLIISTDIISEDPARGEGYYFTALAFFKLLNIDKAKEYLTLSSQKKNTPDNISKINSLKNEIESLESKERNKEKVVSLGNRASGDDYKKLWEQDKTQVEFAVNAIEIYLKENNYFAAITLLEDSSFLKDESARILLAKINNKPEVVNVRKYNLAMKSGQTNYKSENYSSALNDFMFALERIPNDKLALEYVNKSKEELAWKKVINSSNVAEQEINSSLFYKSYPNSKYRNQSLIIWQQTFLNKANNLPDEQALIHLNTLRSDFPSNTLDSNFVNLAYTIYKRKWNDAYLRYSQEYKSSKKDIRKQVGKSWFNTILFSGISYGIGYGISSLAGDEELKQNAQSNGAWSAGFMFLLGFLVDPPWNAAKYRKLESKRLLEKLNLYSKPPSFF